MILINPPVTKPCEPPAGLARLAGVLAEAGHPCRVVDMNIEGILEMLGSSTMGSDVWTSRAARNLPRNLDALRDKGTYRNFDRYKRCVIDLNRLLSVSADGARLSLSDYDEARLSPVRSADLLSAAARPENNPFYNY